MTLNHLSYMRVFWKLVYAARPKWGAAHDQLAQAECAAGIAPPIWGKVLLFPLWRKIK